MCPKTLRMMVLIRETWTRAMLWRYAYRNIYLLKHIYLLNIHTKVIVVYHILNTKIEYFIIFLYSIWSNVKVLRCFTHVFSRYIFICLKASHVHAL